MAISSGKGAELKGQQKIFEQYVGDKKILIADPSSVARTTLASLLCSLGAKTANIIMVPNYQMAEEELERMKPKIVITDYELGKQCGLDLLQKQRNQHPETKDCLFVLVTGNGSQTAVAKAAEEDVDTYILKPFTVEVLRQSILRAALQKINPTEYMKLVQQGKDEIINGKIEEGLATLDKAIKADPVPALACFYHGQGQMMKNNMDGAEADFRKGLEFNKIHYKCLIGLYEVMMAQKRHDEAYDTIKKVSQYFPDTPQRLTAVLKLAILTRSYEDVERYYRVFTTLGERSEEMIKYVCAAMIVCGKYYLQKNLGTRALELFTKAATSAGGRTKILREIVMTLVNNEMGKQAEDFLKRFSSEDRLKPDFLSMDLLVMDKVKPPGVVIEAGRALIAKEIYDPVIYEIVIKRSAEAGFTDSAENLSYHAIKRWPDQKDHFAKLAKTQKADKAASSEAS